MLCSTCSKRGSCEEPCDKVESFLKRKSKVKSTFRKKEIAICEMTEDNKCFERYMQTFQRKESNGQIKNRTVSHKLWMKIMTIVNTQLTHNQKTYLKLFLEENTMATIGRLFHISGRAVSYAIFGDPRNGGGAVRKIQIALGIVGK